MFFIYSPVGLQPPIHRGRLDTTNREESATGAGKNGCMGRTETTFQNIQKSLHVISRSIFDIIMDLSEVIEPGRDAHGEKAWKERLAGPAAVIGILRSIFNISLMQYASNSIFCQALYKV